MVRARDRGQVLPLVALVLALAGLAAAAIGRIGEAAVQRAQARAAADAAALAAALGDEAAAHRVTEENGATLVALERDGRDVRARVTLGRARATARARASGGGRRGAAGLAPAMRAALARARELLGQEVPVTSGYRSPQEQAALYRRRDSNAYPVAPPGRSLHEHGLAIDVPLAFVPRLLPVAPLAGLCRPYPVTDPVHFELCRRGP